MNQKATAEKLAEMSGYGKGYAKGSLVGGILAES
jgi:hypothetical protein